MKKYYFMEDKAKSYQGTEIIMLCTPLIKFKWFTDCGDWFVYFVFGDDECTKWVRFSNCGTLSNFIKRWY